MKKRGKTDSGTDRSEEEAREMRQNGQSGPGYGKHKIADHLGMMARDRARSRRHGA